MSFKNPVSFDLLSLILECSSFKQTMCIKYASKQIYTNFDRIVPKVIKHGDFQFKFSEIKSFLDRFQKYEYDDVSILLLKYESPTKLIDFSKLFLVNTKTLTIRTAGHVLDFIDYDDIKLNPSIRKLTMDSQKITLPSLCSVNILHHPDLQELEIGIQQLNIIDGVLFEHNNLKCLKICTNCCTNLKFFGVHCPNIETLNVISPDDPPIQLDLLEYIMYFPNLKTLKTDVCINTPGHFEGFERSVDILTKSEINTNQSNLMTIAMFKMVAYMFLHDDNIHA